MRFALLGSGSEGNALLIEAGGTRVLVDCGFGLAETQTRLARLNVELAQLDAILVTHEHGDHASGVARAAAKAQCDVYLTYGTYASLPQLSTMLPVARVRVIDSHAEFAIGALRVRPFPVPHDAREPVQFVFEHERNDACASAHGAARLGVLTDVGGLTPHIERILGGCDALVLECNYDARMLREGPYPASLKARVASRTGHLDNATAGELLQRTDTSRLKCLVAAHLSLTNNKPELARKILANALGCAADWVAVADQTEGLHWREVVTN